MIACTLRRGQEVCSTKRSWRLHCSPPPASSQHQIPLVIIVKHTQAECSGIRPMTNVRTANVTLHIHFFSSLFFTLSVKLYSFFRFSRLYLSLRRYAINQSSNRINRFNHVLPKHPRIIPAFVLATVGPGATARAAGQAETGPAVVSRYFACFFVEWCRGLSAAGVSREIN